MTTSDVRICASRGRGTDNQQTLEIGSRVSNALTSVEKDNYLHIEYEV